MFSLLKDQGYLIAPRALSPPRIAQIRDDLLNQRSAGRMKPAGIGKTAGLEGTIRQDEILWLQETELPPEIADLRQRLNRELFLGLKTFEGHYAHYAPGGFYRRHLDRFKHDDARTVSLILYLNDRWRAEDGGQLRLYTKVPVDVEPRAGTLVLFMSGEIEHEVLQSHAPRLSFTGWFKT